jgi:hypothetical protein
LYSRSLRSACCYVPNSRGALIREATIAQRVGGSAESRARLRTVEEPQFDEYRRQFFALDEFPENEARFAITYAEVFAEVESEG